MTLKREREGGIKGENFLVEWEGDSKCYSFTSDRWQSNDSSTMNNVQVIAVVMRHWMRERAKKTAITGSRDKRTLWMLTLNIILWWEDERK